MAAAAASSSVAATIVSFRVPTATTRCSAFPCLPPRSSGKPFPAFSSSKQLSYLESRSFPLPQVRASDEPPAVDANEIFTDLKEKWDAVENKSTVIIYGGGAIVVVWLSSIVIGAINSIPLLPKIMEFVGLGYTGWFVYRYLLFKSARKELATDIEALKNKITGTD